MFRARENGNIFHQILHVQPKTGNLLHFSHAATYVYVERHLGKELLNGLLSQWASAKPKCFLGTVKTAENIVELY